ncbi:alcohol dehydrogenase [Mycena leptocephala]|nr:alcohol dehydrogenase [Mycena leptocephala]
MAPVTNTRVLFAAVPKDFPIPGETTVTIHPRPSISMASPLNGGFLIKTLVLSVDPYMPGGCGLPRRNPTPYAPFTLGAPLEGYGVGVGKYVYGKVIPHQQYSIMSGMEGLIFLEKDPNCVDSKTAYMAWKEFSHAKKGAVGETAFITTGAGPVGSATDSRSLPLPDLRRRSKFMKDIGADVAFNYKTTDTREVLAREGPLTYWDNVGGDILDAALEHANVFGRILGCGMISGYNTGHKAIKNLSMAYSKSLTISGIIYDAEFYATIPAALASGELKYTEEVSRGWRRLEMLSSACRRGGTRPRPS